MARSLRRFASPKISGAYRGINMHGVFYGNDVHYSLSDYQYLASKGFTLVRIPFSWESIQPTVLGGLDSTYKGYIDTNIAYAKSVGIKAVIDCHNYGRRDISSTPQMFGDGVLTTAHFNDLWLRLSNAYKDESAVIAYGLMNEPHNLTINTTPLNYLTTSTWRTYAQSAIDTIRANSDSKIISVALDAWSAIRGFTSNYGSNPTPWIDDDNYWLEGHIYFDNDNSGVYSDGASGTGKYFASSGRVMGEAGDVLATIASWCRTNGIPLYIGESGIPTRDEGYRTVMNDFLNVADQYRNHFTWWWFSDQTIATNTQIYGNHI